MSFKETPLAALADEIVYSEGTSGAYQWKFEFKLQDDAPPDLSDPDIAVTDREQNGFYTPMKVTNLDFIQDFEKAAAEHVNCQAIVSSGMWLRVLQPSRKKLLAHITREKLKRVEGEIDEEEEPKVFIYKVLIKLDESQDSESNTSSALTRQELDMRGFVTLDMDLVDRGVEQARNIAVGGIWRDTTPKEVIQSILMKECEDIEVDGEKVFKGVEFAKGYSTDVKDHVIIEQGLPLLNVAHHIHRNIAGVWPTGINCYFHEGYWHVYPLYDTTRFDDESHTLTIVRVPQKVYQSPENTYMDESGRIKIIATSDSALLDATHLRYLTEGDGVRFADANAMMGDWAKTEDNKAVAQRSKKNSELRIDDKTTPDHHTRLSGDRITSNPLLEYSRLAGRKGKMLSFVWENADHTLLRPGMMCKILYNGKDDVAELEGVLLNAQASVQLFGQGMSADSYRNTCTLFVFCNVTEEEPNDN